MKEFENEVTFPLSAPRLWKLKSIFEIERRIAEEEGRYLHVEEEEERAENEDGFRKRVVVATMTDQEVPVMVRNLLGGKPIVARTVARWHDTEFDEAHCSTFTTTLEALGDRFLIEGRQWIVDSQQDACTMCTKVRVNIKVPFIAGKIEAMLQERMVASYEQYPERVARHSVGWEEWACGRRDASTSTDDLCALELQDDCDGQRMPCFVGVCRSAPRFSRHRTRLIRVATEAHDVDPSSDHCCGCIVVVCHKMASCMVTNPRARVSPSVTRTRQSEIALHLVPTASIARR